VAKFELSRLVAYDAPSLVAEIRRVAALIPGKHLSQQEFNRLAKCSSSAVRRRFGSWRAALAAAGLGDRYSGGVGGRGKKQRFFTDEELLAELRCVSSMLSGRPVTVEAFQVHARMNAETVRRRFGSWGKALQKAGLTAAPLGRRYSDDDYFENLLAVWTHYGRQPTYGEMDRPPSRIPSGAYEAKWGTWRKALLAFIQRADADVAAPPPVQEEASPLQPSAHRPKDSPELARRPSSVDRASLRQIPLGLRYQVLSRDRFRCVLCGGSPATRPGCELHVDHVLPFARGGRTVLGNLRTLCHDCNLGKGVRIGDEPT